MFILITLLIIMFLLMMLIVRIMLVMVMMMMIVMMVVVPAAAHPWWTQRPLDLHLGHWTAAPELGSGLHSEHADTPRTDTTLNYN